MMRTSHIPLFFILFCVTFGCQKELAKSPLPVPEVVVEPVLVRDVQQYIEETAVTDAYETVEIPARVSGFLQEIRYAAGDVVPKGAPLFLIQPEQYQAELKAAEGALASAQAHLKLTEANLSRTQQLFERATLTKEDLDTATAQRDESAAAVIQAEAQLATAQLNLSYTDIRSPITGKANPSIFSVGNLVGPTGLKVNLATIAGMDPIYILFDISDTQFNNIRAYAREHHMPVMEAERLHQIQAERDGTEGSTEPEGDAPPRRLEELQIPIEVSLIVGSDLAPEEYPFKGIVETAFNTIDPSTGTIMMRGIVPNEDYTLFPGQICRVRIPTWSIPDAVLVRQEAIGTDMNQRYVYVVDETNVAHRRVVELGAVQADGTRVVTKGLEKGERYVVSGIQRVRDGSQVKIREQ